MRWLTARPPARYRSQIFLDFLTALILTFEFATAAASLMKLQSDAFYQYLWEFGYFHEQNKQVVLVTLCLIFFTMLLSKLLLEQGSKCINATTAQKIVKRPKEKFSFLFFFAKEEDGALKRMSRQFWLWGSDSSFLCVEIMMTTASIMWYLKARN